MPQELQLPDGRILVLPDNMRLDQRAALRNKLGSQYADVKTGVGMQQRAVQQSRNQLASRIQPNLAMRTASGPDPLMGMESGLSTPAQVPENARAMEYGAAIGAPLEMGIAGGARSIPTIARTVGGAAVGSAAGSYGGGKLGGLFGPKGERVGEEVGAIAGGLAGGYGEYRRMPPDPVPESFPVSKSPGPSRGPSSVPKPVSDPLVSRVSEGPGPYTGPKSAPPLSARVSSGPGPYTGPSSGQSVGVPGTAAQEAGYQPPITKVPIRPTPTSPLTPQQVPGPDRAGKGNLLTPAARRGDPRAASELQRRGRTVLHVPAEEYPGTRLEGTLQERIGLPDQLTLSQRTSYRPSEKAATMSAARKSLGPEFEAQQREEQITRYKNILRNSQATGTDLAEARARLRELGAVQ